MTEQKRGETAMHMSNELKPCQRVPDTNTSVLLPLTLVGSTQHDTLLASCDSPHFSNVLLLYGEFKERWQRRRWGAVRVADEFGAVHLQEEEAGAGGITLYVEPAHSS